MTLSSRRVLRGTALLVLAALPLHAQGAAPTTGAAAGAPDTDIWIARLTTRNGAVAIGAPRNLTNRTGYDNQPSFDARGRTIYYTRRAPNALLTNAERDVQTDIWSMAIDGTRAAPAMVTAESEYSAQVTPDGRAVTVIRVERDSAQHLWRMPLTRTGTAARLVGSVKPVGYYAWVGSQVAMFVLGSPATLQLMDTVSGRRDTIARDIGRGVKRVPGRTHVTFVQKEGATWFIDELDPSTRTVVRLVPTLPRVDDYTWLDGQTLLAGAGTTLHTWTRGATGWTQVADFASVGLKDITRVTTDPSGRWLAFVALPAARH